ncbi:glycerophosphodiester phosphodiesterase [Nocardia sp. NPDC060249]|uniref:glycerophosphodiester phosphodiesterase n=1 Tax=Nocardia sp. NPDC060249 TaxID=3347082 RepID=UPI0036515E2F
MIHHRLHPFLDSPTPIAFAHRGDATHAPENTLPAFEAAARLGYQYVETDVHVTSDGVVVAFHNQRLDGSTNCTGRIDELPWSKLRTVLVDHRENIPTLEEILRTWPEMRINIDVKSDAAVAPLVDLIVKCNASHRVCIGSFREHRVRSIRSALGEDACTSMGPWAAIRLRLSAYGFPLPIAEVQCAQLPARPWKLKFIDPNVVELAHRRGIKVHAWTVNEKDEMTRLLDAGVDGIMTDRPMLLRTILKDRNLWPGQQ